MRLSVSTCEQAPLSSIAPPKQHKFLFLLHHSLWLALKPDDTSFQKDDFVWQQQQKMALLSSSTGPGEICENLENVL